MLGDVNMRILGLLSEIEVMISQANEKLYIANSKVIIKLLKKVGLT